MPVRWARILAWFNRPGKASNFIPILGIAQSWITSVAVMTALTVVSTGNTTGSSTANNRNSPNSKSLSGTK